MHDTVILSTHQNEGASRPLVLTLQLACNTDDEVIAANVRHNAAREDVPWMKFHDPHYRTAVVVGGGPSLVDHLDMIAELASEDTDIIAINAAASWLYDRFIGVDYQCIIDARPENVEFLDDRVPFQLLASQVDPALVDAASNPTLMHLMTVGVEDHLPQERKVRGDYALLGGGYGCGNTAICAAYVLGYRKIYCAGMDSSNRGDQRHVYFQALNAADELIETKWDGETYVSSLTMKAQAERFQIIAHDLTQLGCDVRVIGDGLLPAMWRTRGRPMDEREKYRALWETDTYRKESPGEKLVPVFLKIAQPDGPIIDFGCGSGRAGVELKKAGHGVILIDFAPNCLDPEARELPFFECDLTQAMPVQAPYGFCADVMEHIPPDDVDTVLSNIFQASENVFFNISTIPDVSGGLIGHALHLTVRPHEWWAEKLSGYGTVQWTHNEDNMASLFYVERTENT